MTTCLTQGTAPGPAHARAEQMDNYMLGIDAHHTISKIALAKKVPVARAIFGATSEDRSRAQQYHDEDRSSKPHV